MTPLLRTEKDFIFHIHYAMNLPMKNVFKDFLAMINMIQNELIVYYITTICSFYHL